MLLTTKWWSLDCKNVPLFRNYSQVFGGLTNILKVVHHVREHPRNRLMVRKGSCLQTGMASNCTASSRVCQPVPILSKLGVLLFYAIKSLMYSAVKNLWDYEVKEWWSIWKKEATCRLDPWQPARAAKAAGWIMQEPYPPLCLILHCFCRENFCLPSKSCHLRLSSRLSNHQNGIKCCKAVQQENFQKSEPICRAALVENVFCSRQNFPSVLSTEKFTDFSQWNLLEFIGSWLAVTD